MPSSVISDASDHEVFSLSVDIEELQSHGIGATDIQKLKSNGYFTVSQVHGTMKKKLLQIRGFSDIKVDKVKEAVAKCLPNNSLCGFVTASELCHERKSVHIISTGSKQLDATLGGGIRSRSITEVYGEFRCGKTQLGQTLAVVAQLPKDLGGAEGKVVYMDSEGTFRPERIKEIATRFGVDPEATCDNILTCRSLNSEQQMDQLNALSSQFVSGEYRLLIIDSIMACFRTDYQGRGELQLRQAALGQLLQKINLIATEFNIAVYLTNQVQSDPGASALFAGADGRKPLGGHVLAHASHTRILLRKGRAEERVAKIVDSPDVPEGEATYIITAGGINDPEKA